MILVIDNYDSFTWNLVHLIGGLGHAVRVVRNDALSAGDAVGSGAQAIVISPGPGEPKDAGSCIEIIRRSYETGVPVFGVCLGLQAIAEAFGGKIVRAGQQMHGKTSVVRHNGTGIFKDLPDGFVATRYHSLVAEKNSLPNCLAITAETEDDREIMALEHVAAPIAGVQFHPESIASQYGDFIFRNFLSSAMSTSIRA